MTEQPNTRARSGAPSSLTGWRAAMLTAIRERIPDAFLARRFFFRALGVWLGLRLAVQALATLPEGRVDLTPIALGGGVIPMVAVNALLALVDGVRRNERMLIANLGIGRWVVAAIGAIAAVSGEMAIWVWLGGPS